MGALITSVTQSLAGSTHPSSVDFLNQVLIDMVAKLMSICFHIGADDRIVH